jgi:hypothetical protein
MKKTSLFWIKISLLSLAFGLIIYQSWGELGNIGMIPVFLIIGYLFGKLTCSNHLRNWGFWATFGLFALLNTIHSIIDGTSLSMITGANTFLVMVIHEIVRQPVLYIIILGLIAPFSLSKNHEILIAFISVTGTWIVGMILGNILGANIHDLSWIHPYVASSIFILAGDMIHHVWDEYHHA